MASEEKPGEEPDATTTDPLLKAVGDRIEQIRLAKRMEPVDLAREAGVTLQSLWRLRKGRVNLSLRSISRFAIALDVPMSALLEGIAADPATPEKGPYRRGGGERKA